MVPTKEIISIDWGEVRVKTRVRVENGDEDKPHASVKSQLSWEPNIVSFDPCEDHRTTL